MPSPPGRPLLGLLIVVVAASLFGTLGPLARLAYDAGMTPLSFVTWRGAIGLLATVAFIVWRVRRRGEAVVSLGALDRRARASLLTAAVMGFVLNTCMFIAFGRITVALALLAFYTYPVMVAVGNVILGREPVDRSRLIALVLAVAGMIAVVASQVDPTAGIRLDLLGIALALIAAGSQAVFVIISRSGYRAVPADQAMGVIFAVTAVASLLVALVVGPSDALALPLQSPDVLPLLVFSGLFAAAIPSMLFLTGIRLVGGTTAGIVMLFEPVVGVALAAWLLGEAVAAVQVLGGLAILAAAVILQRGAPAGERVVAAPALEGDVRA
jgi:drug/metabolite transporter (DMT)-like permease